MARRLKPRPVRSCPRTRRLDRHKIWLLITVLLVMFTSTTSAASAQSSAPVSTNTDIAGHRTPNWYRSGGMTLNSPDSGDSTTALMGGNCGVQLSCGYYGQLSPPGWLFTDPDLAEDPWHFLPMTRWARVNDFFSTGEGGIASAFNNVLNASYTTLVAMAFTFASFAWAITAWLVRLMVGAPTLAAQFMSQIADRFNEYAAAVMNTGWVSLLLAVSVFAAGWAIVRTDNTKEALKKIFGAAIPLAMIGSLMTFSVPARGPNGGTLVNPNGDAVRIHGPEWLFATTLRLSTYISEPIYALTDVLTADPHNAPDQLVTCDAYTAVLEGNFIRAWNTRGGDHLESDTYKIQAGGAAGAWVSVPAFYVYGWAKTSDEIRMRIAITVSRIWERSYAVGYGRAQFGDHTTAERAFCLIADWRTRSVSPLEQLAIWRETCFLRAFDRTPSRLGGSLLLGDDMTLTGCSLMPQIEAPPFNDPRGRAAIIARKVQLHLTSSAIPNVAFGGACERQVGGTRGPSRWPHPEEGVFTTSRDHCIREFSAVIGETPDLTDAIDSGISDAVALSGFGSRGRQGQLQILKLPSNTSEDQHLAAEVYASALFNPSNHITADGDRRALRSMHGTFAACDFIGFSSSDLQQQKGSIEHANDNELPLYPTHWALMDAPNGADVKIPTQAFINGVNSYGNVVNVDARMWGLGYDGLGPGGHAQPEEIITPDACMAYLFGSADNEMPDEFDQRSNPQDSVSVWSPSDLGITDDTNNAYKSALGGAENFRWDMGIYPPSTAFYGFDSASRNEYPGANNRYAYNRLGRTPEEYLGSASVWPHRAELQGAAAGESVFSPNLSSSLSGADVFQAIHGRSRAESGIMAVLAVAVAICYLMALSGLALGAALSIVILALLIATLPITLLFAALPFEAARALPKKLLKLGLGASLSYGMFILFISLVLLAIDLILSVVAAVEVRSGEFWYTVLLGVTPLLGLKLVGSLGKHFGLNVTSPKGAFAFTSGMAFANMKEPQGGGKMKNYARRGMRGMAYGPMMRGMTSGGSQIRTTPRTGGVAGSMAAAGMGATIGAGLAQEGGGDVPMADPPRGGGQGKGLFSAARNAKSGSGGRGAPGGLMPKVARVVSPSNRGPREPGKIRRAAGFARSHPALAGAAVLGPLGGVGVAAAFYGASKVAKLTGIGFMARSMIGMPMRGAGRRGGGGDLQWMAGQARQQRQRIAGWMDPTLRSAGDRPIPGPAGHAGAPQQPSQAAAGRQRCLAEKKEGGPCAMWADECFHHTDENRLAARSTHEEQQHRQAYLDEYPKRAQRLDNEYVPRRHQPFTDLTQQENSSLRAADRQSSGICGAPLGNGSSCPNSAAQCPEHRGGGINMSKQIT